MENLEQIITKQNNIREKINEYNRDFELYNKTYIEKFTELKTLKNEKYHNKVKNYGIEIVNKYESNKKLYKNNQIATKYVDFEGNSSMDSQFNPNGSYYAIEGMLAHKGRIFGKMAHSERTGKNLYKNIYGNKDQNIFKNGVKFFL